MKRYRCQFPNCDYETNDRSQINIHHINPREVGGKNQKWNKITLCPTCHSKIYCENSKKGIHSINGEESIMLKGWRNNGNVLEYIDKYGILKYVNKK